VGLARYVGVDLSSAALQRAQAFGLSGCEFVRGDFETWLPTERFDVVVFNESIGYARDPAATVRRFFRLSHFSPWLHSVILPQRQLHGHLAADRRRRRNHPSRRDPQ